jgi:hypothetical protein
MIKAWVLTVFVLSYPGDDRPRLASQTPFATVQACRQGEIDTRASARRMNMEVVTGCIRMFEGESIE